MGAHLSMSRRLLSRTWATPLKKLSSLSQQHNPSVSNNGASWAPPHHDDNRSSLVLVTTAVVSSSVFIGESGRWEYIMGERCKNSTYTIWKCQRMFLKRMLFCFVLFLWCRVSVSQVHLIIESSFEVLTVLPSSFNRHIILQAFLFMEC